MHILLENLIQSGVQLLIFIFLPFFCWVGRNRKTSKFFEYIGIKGLDRGGSYDASGWIIISSILSMVSAFMIITSMPYSDLGIMLFWGGGIRALPVILIYAILTTSLPEEIFFRGFLLKRLSARMGFVPANIIQSILFGLSHGLFLLPDAGIVKVLNISALIAVNGWFMGYINEEKARGSILPSWGIHAITNIYAGICVAFTLFF